MSKQNRQAQPKKRKKAQGWKPKSKNFPQPVRLVVIIAVVVLFAWIMISQLSKDNGADPSPKDFPTARAER